MKQVDLGVVVADGREQLRRLVRLPTLRECEDRYIRRVIKACGGDLTLASKVLKIGRATLYRRAATLDVTTKGQRDRAEQAARARAIREEFATRGPRL